VDAADDEALLRAARAEGNELGATLLSLWERDGRALTSAQGAELAAHRERAARLVRGAARWSRPVRLLARIAQSGVADESGRISDLAADLLDERIGAHRVLALGLPLCRDRPAAPGLPGAALFLN
jgi:hypothetical protein